MPAISSPPQPLPERAFRLPEIVETSLSNGLDVIAVRRPSLPLVSVILTLPGGASAEPAEKSGLASLAADLLQRGTTTRSRDDIADALGRVGARLTASCGADALYISANALSTDLGLAMEILADVALNPTFPADALEQLRERYAANLQVELTNPSAVADRALRAVVYGDHPYGRSPFPQTVRPISRDDVVEFWTMQTNPHRAALVVTGDIDPASVHAFAERYFGGWSPAARQNGASPAPPPERDQRMVYLVDRPGSTQAEIRIGHLGISGSDPDRYRVRVLNEILGGGVRGRLFMNLRERNGYTYGCYSRFTMPRDRGYFHALAAVRNEVAAPATREMLREMETLRASAVPEDELAETLSYIGGAYSLGFESNGAVGGVIVNLWLLSLPLSNLSTDLQALTSVTAEGVHDAAVRHLLPDIAAITVVGDASLIRSNLEALAPVVLIDAAGQPKAG